MRARSFASSAPTCLRILSVTLLAPVATSINAVCARATVTDWYAADNPHVLTTDVVVGVGDVLRIHPGTEVRLDPSVRVWVNRGRIESLGTEADPILFTRNQPDTYWTTLTLQNSTNNVIRHTTFEYASTDSTLSDIFGGAVFLAENATAVIENSEFRHTKFSAVFGQGYSEVVIRDSHVFDIGLVGIHMMWAASARIERCEIHNVGYNPPWGSEIGFQADAIEFSGNHPDPEFHEIIDCLIYDIANDGIDLDLDIDATISGNLIFDCADKAISVAQGSRATITNTAMFRCHWGLGPQSGAAVSLANCVIYDCDWGVYALIDDVGWPGATANVTNLVVWNTLHESVRTDAASTVNASYCNFENAYAGIGNISLDPMFADPDAGDFHLQAPSPCIDAGFSGAPVPGFDIDGNPRVDHPDVVNSGGGAFDYYDIGIDEYWGGIVGVAAAEPERVPILRVRPNPAAGSALVEFHLASPEVVSVTLFDGSGRLVRVIPGLELAAGDHAIPVNRLGQNGSLLAPGVYFVRVDGPEATARTKLVLR